MKNEANKINLLGFERYELQQIFESLHIPAFRANQVWQWIYQKGVKQFDQMSNLPIKLRNMLDETYTIEGATISKELISLDGTRKWLLRFPDGNEIETVFIPEETRGTLCVSSQIGCTLNCSFCHTGTQQLVRNLTPQEIIAQVIFAKDQLQDWVKRSTKNQLTNIVMMGMGEPLLNYEHVAKALKIIMDTQGLKLSKRKITLSTAGIVPFISRCGEELGVNLAISLHATSDSLRNQLVPINKKYAIKELIEACRNYAPTQDSRRKITFEYVMLKNINDTKQDAIALVNLLKGIPAKINLIPFNEWPGTDYISSDKATIEAFAAILERAGYISPVRKPRGEDILAACGQLKSASKKLRTILK